MQRVEVSDRAWRHILAAKSGAEPLAGADWSEGERRALAVYGRIAAARTGPQVFAQIGQSLDGRIATETGDACDVSGADGLAHLHRLRALADVVVIGVGTALHDDPRLTVRLADGQSPARVVIDPNGRLPQTAKLLHDGSVRRIVIQSTERERPDSVETITLERSGWICPEAIVTALTAQGFRRILIEGGGITIARFLEAGLLDRLHVTVAPLLIGSGPQSITTSPVGTLARAMRPQMQAFDLGSDVLFDCRFGGQP